MKVIKLMPDYGCYPLWDMTPGMYQDIDPKFLPISELLRQELMDWAKTYDETLNLDDPLKSGFLTTNEKIIFEKKGNKIAHDLRKELGQEFLIEENFLHI